MAAHKGQSPRSRKGEASMPWLRRLPCRRRRRRRHGRREARAFPAGHETRHSRTKAVQLTPPGEGSRARPLPSSQPHGTVYTSTYTKLGAATGRYILQFEFEKDTLGLVWSGLVWRLILAPAPPVLCLCTMPCRPCPSFSLGARSDWLEIRFSGPAAPIRANPHPMGWRRCSRG